MYDLALNLDEINSKGPNIFWIDLIDKFIVSLESNSFFMKIHSVFNDYLCYWSLKGRFDKRDSSIAFNYNILNTLSKCNFAKNHYCLNSLRILGLYQW